VSFSGVRTFLEGIPIIDIYKIVYMVNKLFKGETIDRLLNKKIDVFYVKIAEIKSKHNNPNLNDLHYYVDFDYWVSCYPPFYQKFNSLTGQNIGKLENVQKIMQEYVFDIHLVRRDSDKVITENDISEVVIDNLNVGDFIVIESGYLKDNTELLDRLKIKKIFDNYWMIL
jgi:hypothetical protein